MADPLHQFVIEPIIDINIGGFDLSFTNSALWMAIAVCTATIYLTISMREKALVPGRMQMFSEMCYQFIANMVRENIGSKGREYFPFVFTVFAVVVLGNMLGLLPYSFTYTSHLIVTGAMALTIFGMVIVLALIRHGFHFFSIFVPPDVPLWMLPLVIALEVLSFFVRPVTLAVRLFANMMAGHLMLKVFAGFSVAAAGMGVFGVGLGLFPAAFNTVMIVFEVLIAFLQAYVFAILTCIYLKDTVELAH
jgi:F-type H+-transporting ATPase subunit a